MSIRRRGHRAAPLALAGTLALGLAACGSHRLADFSYAGRSLAVVHLSAPAPGIWSGGYRLDGRSAVEVVAAAGSQVARDVEAHRARSRLDDAAARVDVAERIAARTGARVGRYLGAVPVEDERAADYVLELDIHRYGIDAAARGAAYLFMRAEAVLLDARTGTEIWHEEIDAWERLSPYVRERGIVGEVAADVVAAGALSTLSEEDFERILERLADFAADAVTDELREDLRDVRRR